MEHYDHDVTDPPVHCRKDNSCTRQQPPNVHGASTDGTKGRNQQSYNDYSTSLSPVYRTYREKINKEIKNFSNIINID